MKCEIKIPETAMPKKDPVNPCPCQFRPVKLKNKTGVLTWLVQVGEAVKKDQVVCEGEVEKKTIELLSPVNGILSEICIHDEEEFSCGDVLGYVEAGEDDGTETN